MAEQGEGAEGREEAGRKNPEMQSSFVSMFWVGGGRSGNKEQETDGLSVGNTFC